MPVSALLLSLSLAHAGSENLGHFSPPGTPLAGADGGETLYQVPWTPVTMDNVDELLAERQ